MQDVVMLEYGVTTPPVAVPLKIRDRMLVAYREANPDCTSGGDGYIVLGYNGEGLEWWMGQVSPNVNHWRYEGVPSLDGSYGISATPLPQVSERKDMIGLWVWEGWVEGSGDKEGWVGRWRRATAADLAFFGCPLAEDGV